MLCSASSLILFSMLIMSPASFAIDFKGFGQDDMDTVQNAWGPMLNEGDNNKKPLDKFGNALIAPFNGNLDTRDFKGFRQDDMDTVQNALGPVLNKGDNNKKPLDKFGNALDAVVNGKLDIKCGLLKCNSVPDVVDLSRSIVIGISVAIGVVIIGSIAACCCCCCRSKSRSASAVPSTMVVSNHPGVLTHQASKKPPMSMHTSGGYCNQGYGFDPDYSSYDTKDTKPLIETC